MVYSQKYCLVQLIEHSKLNDEFVANDWPLHTTIAGVFALDWNEERLIEFKKLVKSHYVFSSFTTSVEYFGLEHDVKVRLMERGGKLLALHNDLVNFIHTHDGIFNDLHYQLDGFLPHVTMRYNQPHENLTITFDQLALIDMFPNGDHTRRKIIKLFQLSTVPSQN